MKKRVAAVFLAIIILVGVATQKADARSVTRSLDLTFNGTVATCTFTAIEVGSDIKVTMSLWQGSRQIASWKEEGVTRVRMNEQCEVSKGQTYTLQVSFTIDGKAQPEQSVTKSN